MAQAAGRRRRPAAGSAAGMAVIHKGPFVAFPLPFRRRGSAFALRSSSGGPVDPLEEVTLRALAVTAGESPAFH